MLCSLVCITDEERASGMTTRARQWLIVLGAVVLMTAAYTVGAVLATQKLEGKLRLLADGSTEGVWWAV